MLWLSSEEIDHTTFNFMCIFFLHPFLQSEEKMEVKIQTFYMIKKFSILVLSENQKLN